MSSKVQFAGVSERTDDVRRQQIDANKSALTIATSFIPAILSCKLYEG